MLLFLWEGKKMKKVYVREKTFHNEFIALLVKDLKYKFIVKLITIDVIMHFPKDTYEYVILED